MQFKKSVILIFILYIYIIKQLYYFSDNKFMFNAALSEQILVDNIKSLSNNTRYL